MVITLRCGRGNLGSIPGLRFFIVFVFVFLIGCCNSCCHNDTILFFNKPPNGMKCFCSNMSSVRGSISFENTKFVIRFRRDGETFFFQLFDDLGKFICAVFVGHF